MELIRVLRNGIGLKPAHKGEDLNAQTACGSAYANFVMTPRKGLSFYDGSEASVKLKDIALGVMLAKLTGANNEKVGWDDVESCLISLDAIQRAGVKAFQDGKGETVFPDVNAVHWAVEDINIKALADIVVAAVSPLKIVFIARYDMVAQYDFLVETGKIPPAQFGERATKDLVNLRGHPKYQRAIDALRTAE